MASGYGIADWRDDLKTCFMRSGLEDKLQTFLFCDTQIIDESMLEDINGALNYGDTANLYKREDMEEILKQCKYGVDSFFVSSSDICVGASLTHSSSACIRLTLRDVHPGF